MTHIIGITGENGAGKDAFTTFFRAAAAPLTVAKLRFSDVLTDTLNLWGLQRSRANLQNLAIIMDHEFGKGSLTRATEAMIKKKKADFLIIEGVRWKTDVPMIKSFPESSILYITANPKIRYQRMKARREKVGEDSISFEQFEKEEKAETELQIPEIGKEADVRIENNGTIEEFRGKVEEFYKTTFGK